MCKSFFGHRLGRAQHALILALGIDNALGRRLCLREDGLHDEAGTEYEFVEPVLIGGKVRDRPGGNAAVHGSLGHGGGDPQNQPRIEGIGDDGSGPECTNLASP